MGWRDHYTVHPAADVVPMMGDEELAKMGEDILANGQKIPILFWNGDGKGPVLIDGRNRLEAMERIGMDPAKALAETFICKDPATHIITLNIHRRHLTKGQKADLIVAIHKAAEEAKEAAPDNSRQVGEKSKPGRKRNPAKAAAIADAKAGGISKRTVERSLAKAADKEPSTRHHHHRAEIKRDTFREGFLTVVEGVGESSETISDEALDLLTTQERAAAVETIDTTMTKLGMLLDRLRNKRVPQEGAPQTRRKRGSPVPGVEPV